MQKENKNFNHKKRIRFIEIKPNKDFIVNCTVDFPYSGIQNYVLKSFDDYYSEISPFKTHMNKEYYEYYKKNMDLKYQNIS